MSQTLLLLFIVSLLNAACGHQHHHHDHHELDHAHDAGHPHDAHDAPSPSLHALAATAAVSILPIFIIFFIPLLRQDKKTGVTSINAPLLRTLLAFAVGGLLGDALLHLIPHSLEQSPPHMVGLLTLLGLFVFFILEKAIRAIHTEDVTAACKKDDDHIAHGHSHGHGHGHAHGTDSTGDSIGGILNLMADFSHNWTDGMALAASFMTSSAVGFSTAVAIMLHEIPHEVGDYALLVQSGMSQHQALAMQFVTAIGALAGCGMGLIAGDMFEGFQQLVLPFTAGGFIYIALVETVPVLMQGISLGWRQSLIEAVACGTGVFAMVVIALFE